jgi:hypothetical protein
LQSDFYTGSAGVTLTATGDVDNVMNGAGPGQSNTSSPPLSPGEGPHAPSNYLNDGTQISSLTISFDAPVFGAGLFTIDHFNPGGDNPLTLEAFDGPNGTGNSLGIATSVAFNYQPNNLYFMGVTSDSGGIQSVVFTDVSTSTGDVIGLDDIWFATAGDVPPPQPPTVVAPIPVPATGPAAKIILLLSLLIFGALSLRRFNA